ncbi:MAG: dicarboxylate/amino acid:cation symporter [Phenylobacterium sp.]|uniref:Dicarboxylate/amino acid:cation symporter n=1 Tax=Phenylobacterium ferrooxidans TaxID=2982689 RepID=A0ABW6CRX5_9CAUL|nr:dicarboxylate/amino acid:cation symporter [Phenylobacterium sp.]MDO8322507.1 dicarboxylate/amino acid:cation symporter [Phenylobacterium sp.]MDO8914442.1 dicarboxylate/amino acid:cation symporter [Phenylobacterium sp.]MDP2010403.1 dicarboxylate/amino acid:cation symporter [Phenylobacterium sp.]MDP3102893.1 dicarboxylate/amino acid:cation symporter [Phenylobacterium sp.]
MNRLFTAFIVGAMILGVAVGWGVNQYATPEQAKEVASNLSIITDVFLRLIKMIIAPLVFATLVAGIAHMEDAATVGRVGAKAMGWFITASIVSLTIGLIMSHLLHPGAGLSLPNPDAVAGATVDVSKFTLREFITHLVPKSIVEAMANNEILQIVIFSVFVGTAVAAIDDKAPAVLALVEQIATIMLKVTGYVMKTAPLAIFAALASTIAVQGLEILGTYAAFVGGFYLSLGILWALLVAVLILIVGPRGMKLVAAIRQPALLAFSTASSEAAYPRTLEELQKWGVSRKVASFVLPLGYSFNLDGSMMYCTFAVLFIAQAYGIDLSIGQQLTMLALLMVTSKGMAGVPRASLVVIAATLSYFNLPEAGLILILAVDHLLDMGRSATNVVGNSVAAAVVAKWENQVELPEPEPEPKVA